jgi:hypothetical protein
MQHHDQAVGCFWGWLVGHQGDMYSFAERGPEWVVNERQLRHQEPQKVEYHVHKYYNLNVKNEHWVSDRDIVQHFALIEALS